MNQSHEIIKHALIRVKHHFMHACTRRESDKPQHSVYVQALRALAASNSVAHLLAQVIRLILPPPAFDLSHAGRWTSYILHCK